jgi:hypothetical protein
VKRENRVDEGRAGGRETRVRENLLGRVNGAANGLGNSGRTGLGGGLWGFAAVPANRPTRMVSSKNLAIIFLADVQADQDKIAKIAFATLRETDISPVS